MPGIVGRGMWKQVSLNPSTVSRKHSMTNRGAERGSLPGNISQVVCSWSYVVAYQIEVFILDVS